MCAAIAAQFDTQVVDRNEQHVGSLRVGSGCNEPETEANAKA